MIKFIDVDKYYGKHKVLDQLNFQINKGEIFGIIGQSGAGKSTLVRAINKLTKIDSGKVIVDEKTISNLEGKELNQARREIGFIFQDFNLLNSLTVFENIKLSLQFTNISEAEKKVKVNDILKVVELEEHGAKYPKELSGGQKQRVGIARALVLNPKVLLCDELTSALDPKTSKQISNLLIKINKEMGVTIVIITHEMDFVIETCDRALILDQGKQVELAEISELLLNPQSAQAKALVDSINKLNHIYDGLEVFKASHPEGKVFEIKYANTEQSLISDIATEIGCGFNLLGGSLNQTKSGLFGVLYVQIYTKLDLVESYFADNQIINREVK